jgi:hypothetical protein
LKIKEHICFGREPRLLSRGAPLLIDKQGVTGKKTEYHSIPYKNITHFSIETAGHLDLDSELKIWVKGGVEPIEKRFKSDSNIKSLQKTLATYVLRD